MQESEWKLLYHNCILEQIANLHKAAKRAEERGDLNNANIKLLKAIATLVLKDIPSDPSHSKFRQGKTMGAEYKHWRRAKIGRRFRLFFRYDSASKIIVYVWINDENTLRSSGSSSDPYAMFKKMLDKGNPPDTWDKLCNAAKNFAFDKKL